MAELRRDLLRSAREALGVERFALSIHDASFPAGAHDPGRGSACSESAFSLLEFAAGLGFDVLQLGPQGETGAHNPSPYEGAAFSRSLLAIDAVSLARPEWGALLGAEDLTAALAARPEDSSRRADHAFAWETQRRLLSRAFARARERTGRAAEAWRADEEGFERRHGAWVARDGLYEVLSGLHRGRGFAEWPEPDCRMLQPRPRERSSAARRRRALEREHREALERHRFIQRVAYAQHAALRSRLKEIGMRVYADLQIGLADRDVWAYQHCLLDGYRLGAPPSRTNPDGQPWGFPALDPAREAARGGPRPAVAGLLRERAEHLFAEHDGVRVDHPHGLVCPWLYRSDAEARGHVVRDGARLYSASGVPGHEELARCDIARPDQIDPLRPPWDDARVRDLEPAQVDRYAALFGELVGAAERTGAGSQALVCEVLSTMPLPLGRVLERFGLGRFRVTGKIDPDDPADPYRVERAQPPDWMMIGTHDTPSVWQLVERWSGRTLTARAAYAAERLEPAPGRRVAFAEALARDPGLLAQALLAELFVGRARNAMVFFSDLLGLAETYNRPGTVSTENWSLRAPPDFRNHYTERVRGHRALNVPLALALALRARDGAPADLVEALFAEAARLAPLPSILREPRS